MLTEAYIGALLVDEELADLVWYVWNQGQIDNETARIAWLTCCYANPKDIGYGL